MVAMMIGSWYVCFSDTGLHQQLVPQTVAEVFQVESMALGLKQLEQR